MEYSCFQSATGLSSDTTANVDLTSVYNDISLNSNNNFLFTSNVNFNLNNYISLSSNDNFKFTSNVNLLFSANSNLTDSNISNIYYNYGFLDSNLAFYKLELFKTQLDVIAQKGQIVGLQTSDTIQSASISTMSVSIIDHGSRLTNLENNTYNKTTIDTLISTNSNNCFSNSSNFTQSIFNDVNTNLKTNFFTNLQLSNVFITSNVFSDTSNTLFDFIKISSNNCFSNSSNYTQSVFNDVNTNLKNSYFTNVQLSNVFITSNVLSNTSNSLFDFTKTTSNNCISYTNITSNNCAELSKYLSNNCISYTDTTSNKCADFTKSIKSQLDTSITTQNIDVNKSYDFTFSDSIIHVGNNLCIRKINPANATFFNEMSLCLGIGNASLINIIPFFNNIVVSSSPEFSGLKIHRNGIVLLNSSNNLIINTLDDVQINGTNILFSGKLNFGGTVGTKAPRYFTTNRTASFGGVNCLAYDIDLDLYTRKETIGFYDQRHFRIKFIFGNGRIDYQWAPKEIEVGLSTYNGLSAFAYDVQGTNSLDEAINYNYFLYKQSIDRITICFPTAMFGTNHLTIYFIIQDYLAS